MSPHFVDTLNHRRCFLRTVLALFLSLQLFLTAGEWRNDYDRALSDAKEQNKPLILVFLGTEWCPWSQKLQNEVLSKSEFQEGLNSFVLVKVELPQFGKLDEGKSSLKEKFSVEEVPSLVLIDTLGEEIAKLGYMPLPADEFTSLFQEIFSSYQEIKSAQLSTLTPEALQELYVKALKFGFNNFRYDILAAGLQVDKTPFFLLEKYKILVESGKNKEDEALALKKELIKQDPKNIHGVHRTMAVVDFHRLSSRYRLRKKPDEVVKPLVDYVQKFGDQDEEHLWKIEMMIAQFYFSRDRASKAIPHAEAAFKLAPEIAKAEITESIEFLKTKS